MNLSKNEIDLLQSLKKNSLKMVENGRGLRLESGNRDHAYKLESAGFIKQLRYRRKGFYTLTMLGKETLDFYIKRSDDLERLFILASGA